MNHIEELYTNYSDLELSIEAVMHMMFIDEKTLMKLTKFKYLFNNIPDKPKLEDVLYSTVNIKQILMLGMVHYFNLIGLKNFKIMEFPCNKMIGIDDAFIVANHSEEGPTTYYLEPNDTMGSILVELTSDDSELIISPVSIVVNLNTLAAVVRDRLTDNGVV